MFCGKCGNQIAEGVRFCGSCGWQVPNVEQVPSKPVCKSCGAELKDGTKFCGACGAKIESATAENAPVQSAPPVAPQTASEVKPAPAPVSEQPKVEAASEKPAEPVAKTVSRLVRLTTPDGTMEFKSTGKADDTFLCGTYKIEVLADDEPCGSADCTIANKEE